MVKNHFPDGKRADLTDRRTCIPYLAQMLKFAVVDCGPDHRWLPLSELKLPIGIRGKTRMLKGTTDPRWRTAIGLVAYFGLRHVERHKISANGQLLHCGYRTRTGQCPAGTPPREIVGLDPIGLEGQSANLLAVLAEEGMEAPTSGCRGPRAGDAFYLHCNRSEVFAQLKEEIAATPRTDGSEDKLVPYSLKHGYALMSHSLATQSSTDVAWTDREMKENTLADVQAQVERW